MDMKKVYGALRPLKNRIHLNNAIICVVWGLTAAGGLSVVLSYLALAVPVPFLTGILAAIYAALLCISIITAAFLRPRGLKTIKTADALGLKERLITAYEMKDDRSPLSRIQRYDAFKAASSADFKKLYPIRFPFKTAFAAAALALLAAASFAIPSSSKTIAAGTEKLVKEVKKQAEKIDKERKDLAKKNSLSDEKLKEINKKIDELLKELKRARKEGEAIKAFSRTKHELEKLKNKNEELTKLADKLSNNQVTKEFGEALKNGKLDDLKQKVEQVNEKLKKLDDSERSKLAEEIRKAAREISQNKELVQSLLDLQQSLASGDLGSVGSGMSALGRTLSQMARSDKQLPDAVKQLENAILDRLMHSMDEAKYSISGQPGAASASASQAQNQVSAAQQTDQGQGGNGSGSGQGNQPGQGYGGNGSGKGKDNGSGGGAGEGSTSKDAGYGGDESGSGARDQGKKTVLDYESIYVPERLGGEGRESQVKGRINSSGESQWTEAQNAPVERGASLPYNRVLGQYKSEAMSAIESDNIPPVMRDIIRDYFSSLE